MICNLYHTRSLPSVGMTPRVTPFLNWNVCEMADAMIEACVIMDNSLPWFSYGSGLGPY